MVLMFQRLLVNKLKELDPLLDIVGPSEGQWWSTPVDVSNWSTDALYLILTNTSMVLDADIRAIRNLYLNKLEETGVVGSEDTMVSSMADFHRAIHSIRYFKIKVGGHWIVLEGLKIEEFTSFGGPVIYIDYCFSLQDHTENNYLTVTPDMFKTPITVREVMDKIGLKVATAEDMNRQATLMSQALTLREEFGKAVLSSGSTLTPIRTSNWSSFLDTAPAEGIYIIEPSMEIGSSRPRDQEEEQDIPFVRVFSLQRKVYTYIHVEDIRVKEFDKDARSNVILPPKIQRVMESLFDRTLDGTFGDNFAGRHGGLVIMANGPSGVGKTLTAETFAEVSGRPLYVMEMGEIGTNLEGVEEALTRIFQRASRWNVTLLFDEADIFLARRSEDDLERSAIVGVFLRLMDYFSGMFFLTTNRGDVIDDAFKSRVTVRIDYPALTNESRKMIWGTLLKKNGIQVEGPLDAIAEDPINGRQIRNAVRLLNIMHPGGKVTEEQVFDTLNYVSR